VPEPPAVNPPPSASTDGTMEQENAAPLVTTVKNVAITQNNTVEEPPSLAASAQTPLKLNHS